MTQPISLTERRVQEDFPHGVCRQMVFAKLFVKNEKRGNNYKQQGYGKCDKLRVDYYIAVKRMKVIYSYNVDVSKLKH